MAELELGGARYRTRLLNAIDQFRLLQKLRPILPALSSMDLGMRAGIDLKQFAVALAALVTAEDDDLRYVFRAVLSACERWDGEAWVPVEAMPGMADLLQLVTAVTAENFGPLFDMKRLPVFTPTALKGTVPYKPLAMPDGEDWLWRPMLSQPPLCSLRDLRDGVYRIEDVALFNDILDAADENQARARKAAEASH